MKLTKKAAQKMFTLIEVMIVLAIIGIIAGIGVPQFQKYRDSAYAKKRLLSIESIKTACQSFIIEFDITNATAAAGGSEFWENSKGKLLEGDLGLDLQPFNAADVTSDDSVYSIFDFIKGGAVGLKVGKSDITAPGFTGAVPEVPQAADGSGGSAAVSASVDVTKEYLVDTALWADAAINNVSGTRGTAPAYPADFCFYVEENNAVGATIVYYNNATGLKY